MGIFEYLEGLNKQVQWMPINLPYFNVNYNEIEGAR